MKRFVAALTLLALTGGLVYADYIIIRANVGGAPAQPKEEPKKQAAPLYNPVRPPAGVGVVPPPPPPPPPPGGVFPGGPGVVQPKVEVPPLYATALVEIAGIKLFKGRIFEVPTKWGKTLLFSDQNKILFSNDPLRMPSMNAQYGVRQKDMLKAFTPERRLELAEWCLSRGLVNQFIANMEDLSKGDTSVPAVKEAVAAFNKVQADFAQAKNQALPRDESAIAFWTAQPGFKQPYVTDHYTILYDAPNINPVDVKNRGAKLEQTYKGFYYWFALRGKALPLPKKKLVAVVIDRPNTFQTWHKNLDSVPLGFDGFFARRENTIVFSSSPLDEAYVALANANRQEFWEKGVNMDAMLRGDTDKKLAMLRDTDGRPVFPNFDDLFRCQTLALLQKTMLEEAEVATVTHQGARQLVVASGLLPRNVDAPEWLLFGMASFFETPKRAFWAGFGGPNWEYLWEYKQQVKTLEKPEEALAGVITDYFFQQAHSTGDSRTLHKAQMLSWALTYFLAHRKTDGLMRYFQDLGNLPRDLELDQEVLVANFARAFNLTDAANPDRVDTDKFKRFAAEWFQFIWNTQPPLSDDLMKTIRNVMRPPDQPAMP